MPDAYSQVPIKQVGPNKWIGWIFWADFINEQAQIKEQGGEFANPVGWKKCE